MQIREFVAKMMKKLRINIFTTAEDFSIPSEEVQRLEKVAESDLAKLFYSHNGRIINKWLHYLEIYDKEFAIYRNTSLSFLEIGVSQGGSLELWRKYFGENATIFGIDIDPACAQRFDPPNQVRIGSQEDEAFLIRVLDEIGDPDIVLDDGSHVSRHQMTSFRILFPRLKVGGLYIIEDLHTAYWPESFEGGYRRRGTGIELAKTLVDDMHGWFHNSGQRLAPQTQIASIRFYNSIVVIEKGDISMPGHIQVGQKR